MKNFKIYFFVIITFACFPAHALESFSVQGLLRDSGGLKLTDGTYNMKFTIKTSTPTTVWTKAIAAVPLVNGVFSASLSGNGIEGTSLTTVFSTAPVFTGTAPATLTLDVQVDTNNDGTYDDSFTSIPMTSVPFSLIADRSFGVVAGGIDSAALAANAVVDAKITNATITLAKLAQNSASSGDVVTWNGSSWAAAPVLSSSSAASTGSLTTNSQSGIKLSPFGASAGNTGELRFNALTGTNYVGFKSPDTVAASKIWTLPAADGGANSCLSTDGSASLSWFTPLAKSGGTLTGALNINTPTTADALAQLLVATNAAANKGIVVQAKASQTASLMEFQDSTGAVKTLFAADGTLSSPGASHAEHFGAGSSAAGTDSLAVGYNTTASLANTVLMGSGANIKSGATVGNTVAIGTNAAAGDQATAIGYGSSATTANTAVGYGSTASGTGTAVGYNSTAGNGVAVGTNANSGTNGVAIGRFASVNGKTASVAIGYDTRATRSYQAVIGHQNNYYGNGFTLTLAGADATSQAEMFDIASTWVNTTDASRLTRTTFSAIDYGGTWEGLRIEGDGTQARIGIGGAISASARAQINIGAAADKGLVVKAAASQTGNLQEWQNSSAVAQAIVDASGGMALGAASLTSGYKLDVVGDTRIKGGLCVISGAGVGNCDGTDGKIFASTTAVAQADLAEHMPIGDSNLKPGDVVFFLKSKSNEAIFKKSGRAYQTGMLAVISTQPGLTMGSATKNSAPVALAGRVPVAVTLEGGPIQIGDFLVSSSTPGKAMRASHFSKGAILGVAMSTFDGTPAEPKHAIENGVAQPVGNQVLLLVQPMNVSPAQDLIQNLAQKMNELEKRNSALEVQNETIKKRLEHIEELLTQKRVNAR